jgi:hypothetical protein
MGDGGPAVVTVGPLRAGGSYHFNRLSENDADRSAYLRLTAAEARSLKESGFKVEHVAEADIPSDDPFAIALAAEDAAENSDGDDDDDDDDDADDADDGSNVSPADWTLAMTPLVYLETKPDGPKAQLAHDLIAAGFGNASTKE